MLSVDVHEVIQRSVLCWLATSSASGEPSVSPKEIFAAFDDDSIIIANIASPGSLRNLRENPRACVSFIDVFTQKGYQIKGSAVVLSKGDPRYATIEAALLKLTGGKFPFKTVFRVMADEVREIIAPRYRLFPGTTEAEQIESAMRAYGVRPDEPGSAVSQR